MDPTSQEFRTFARSVALNLATIVPTADLRSDERESTFEGIEKWLYRHLDVRRLPPDLSTLTLSQIHGLLLHPLDKMRITCFSGEYCHPQFTLEEGETSGEIADYEACRIQADFPHQVKIASEPAEDPGISPADRRSKAWKASKLFMERLDGQGFLAMAVLKTARDSEGRSLVQPQSRSRKITNREILICKAIKDRLEGEKYVAFLDFKNAVVPEEWKKQIWPGTHSKAYKNKAWRKKIWDEKNRVSRKFHPK